MTCIVSELGRLVRYQHDQIYEIVHQLNSCDPDSRRYDYLDSRLRKERLIADLLNDLINTILDEDD